MSPINENQKRLLFDYIFTLTDTQETLQAEELIGKNDEARKLYENLNKALHPLQFDLNHDCPDHLVDATVARLTKMASEKPLELTRLLAEEIKSSSRNKTNIWVNFGKRLATAAVFIIVGTLVITTLNLISGYARYNYKLDRCQMQMSNIGRGLSLYKNENDQNFPGVAASNDTPWWKIGDQGKENHSNTRPLWLLVKGGYVKAGDFVCPGTAASTVDDCNKYIYDFPSRNHVTYSFRILCDKVNLDASQTPVMADVNPYFAKLPAPFANFRINLTGSKQNLNSANHRKKGQNVLFSDGSVRFMKTPYIGPEMEDIFTLQNTVVYTGSERPQCDKDIFLAP